VDDEEGPEGADADALNSPRQKKKPALSPLALGRSELGMNQSYMFTQSGTIFVDGFKEGIGREGIQLTRRWATSHSPLSLPSSLSPSLTRCWNVLRCRRLSSLREMGAASRVPMRDRLVILSQLGHGARYCS